MSAGRWSLQDAQNRFSTVVDAARTGKAQVVTRHGKPAAVVLSVEDYERLQSLEKRTLPSFSDLLLAMPQDDETSERITIEPRPVEF
ncbi:type II toxin-antitoxin system Phd/YefM family antitoxin [Geminicoccaceae bacterium 1502E]|nr:type II toxin-antitoxin system Phd/YefM family antitoxin [Geminicoccaceae bacterium 1502E]